MIRLSAVLFLCSAACASAQLLTPVWVELGENGQAVARVIVNDPAACPSINVDGTAVAMRLREPVPAGFEPACEAAIPAGAHAASVNGQALALPKADPQRVVAFGDTGCRIKGARVQDCKDPSLWPFEKVATAIAAEKPDLVIHVGDYLYREEPCPADAQAKCGGTPAGDNWNAWNADFFQPAAKLLAAVPLALSRGNHEDCKRSWRGWFYYLEPRGWTGTCVEYSAPYVIRLGQFEVAMIDSASVDDSKRIPEQIERFTAQLASLKVTHAWIADHHPFWGLRPDAASTLAINTPGLAEAWNQAKPQGIDLVLSGHTHLFEFLAFDNGRPPQVVAGDSGTDLQNPLPADLKGTPVIGATVVSADSRREFGYVLLTRDGSAWRLELRNPEGKARATCRIDGSHASC